MTSVMSAVKFPASRAALPRISSKASGFFFCGMSEEPVVNSSGSFTNANSLVFHIITSSLMRERCVPNTAQLNANSKNMSRSATASMLFPVTIGSPVPGSTNPSCEAAYRRSIGSVVPAIAPLPKGETFAPSAQKLKRSTSLASISTHASMWCATLTGCAL